MSSPALVQIELLGDVRVITLARPAQRNALTPGMLADLLAAIELNDPARALVLAGQGRAFCAGFDLTLCQEHPDGSVMRELLAGLSRVILALRASPRPVVIAAHGAAIAGACALLGGADLVVADEHGQYGYPVLRLGVSPAVSAPFLRLGVGDGPARERLLNTRLITGTQARQIGLAHELCAMPEDVGPRALRLARALAAKPPHALLATRRWLDQLTTAAQGPTANEPGAAEAALRTSLALTGGEEERRMLPAAWRSS